MSVWMENEPDHYSNGEARRDAAAGNGLVYENISTAACVALILLASPLYLFFDYIGQPFRGLVAAMSMVLLMGVAWILRPLAKNTAFWSTLSLIGIAHVALVVFLPYRGNFRFGFAYFPLFFADAYVCTRLIIYACGARLQD